MNEDYFEYEMQTIMTENGCEWEEAYQTFLSDCHRHIYQIF